MKKTYTAQIEQFGKTVKDLRLDDGLTQVQLAEKAGIGERTVQRIESGEISVGLDIIIALSEAFKMEPHELLIRVTFNKRKGF